MVSLPDLLQREKFALFLPSSSAHASADVDTSLKQTVLAALVSRPSINTGNVACCWLPLDLHTKSLK